MRKHAIVQALKRARWLRPLRRGSRGQTLLEFAFVGPIVLVLILSIVDFGIAIDRRLVLQHSVREGARYAAVGGQAFVTGVEATEPEIKTQIADQSQGIADASGGAGGDNYIEVCYEDANGNGTTGDEGDNVQVRVHYTHDFVTGFTEIFDTSLASIAMNPSASARVEHSLPGIGACGPWPP